MQIADLFSKNITRPINGVVKADERGPEAVWQELDEYVVTQELDRHFRRFFESYLQAKDRPNDPTINARMGVWVSGFFGSGKSHFIKILSYLLNNYEALDPNSGVVRKSANFFDDKINDALLLADVKRAVKDETDVILFNIDSKADSKDDRDAILSVFLRVFNEMQGFSGDAPHIAGMERYLVKENAYDTFKDQFKTLTGKEWKDERDAVGFMRDEVVQSLMLALNMSEASAAKWFDDAPDTFRINIENFSKLVKDYLDSKGPKRNIVFLADEIGQFIGENTQMMLTLQTIVENLGTVCKGRAWVIVTSQADIDAVIGDNNKTRTQDFSKIQGRFHTRLSLSSSNTDEVIAKRLLAKTDEAVKALLQLFIEKGDVIKNQLSFVGNDVSMKNYSNEDDFIALYPFAPYHFQLVQKIFEEIRKVGATGVHLSKGERSMLDAFQTAAVHNQAKPLGSLIPVYDFYPSIESFLDPVIKKTIDQAVSNPVLDKFDNELLKALFLIRYIEIIKPNIDNLVTLCIDEVDADRLALKRRIEASLTRLDKENLINRNGDHYYFLTNEEQDVSRQIKQIDPSYGDQSKMLSELLFEDVFAGQSRIRYKLNKTDYDFNRLLDTVPYKTANHELTLEVISPLNDDYSLFNEARCINRSNELLGALIYISDDKALGSELRTWLQVDKYVRNNNTAQAAPTLKKILAEHASDNNTRRSRLVLKLTELIQQADFYALGQKLAIKSNIPSGQLDEQINYLIANSYPKLSYLKVLQADVLAEIRATFAMNDVSQAALNLNGEEGNTQAIKDMRDYLKIAASESRVLLSDVTDRYAKRLYGWPEMETALIIARLFMGGEIKLALDGGDLDASKAFDPFSKAARHRNISILKRKATDAGALNRARGLYKDLFSKLGKEEEDALVAEYREALKAWKQSLDVNKGVASGGQYPGKALIDSAITEITRQLAIKDSFEFIASLNTKCKDWQDLSDDLEDLLGFYAKQRDTWDGLLAALTRFGPNNDILVKDAAANAALNELVNIRNNPAPYGQISRISGLIAQVETVNQIHLSQRREHALSRVDARINEVKIDLEKINASNDLSNQVLTDLQKIRQQITTLTSIPEIHAKQETAAEAQDEANEKIGKESNRLAAVAVAAHAAATLAAKAAAAAAPVGSPAAVVVAVAAPAVVPAFVMKPTKTIKAADVPGKSYMETAEDVDAYISQLRQQLLAAIQSGHKARIQ
ncbi:MAG: BREX system P-loop protein BrxC [Burkholderiaceae bacterium]|nr:BREX system P-loop protein BrxC [Burkholderiaceae bacterium]